MQRDRQAGVGNEVTDWKPDNSAVTEYRRHALKVVVFSLLLLGGVFRLGMLFESRRDYVFGQRGPWRVRTYTVDGEPLLEWVSLRKPVDQDGMLWFMSDEGVEIAIRGTVTVEKVDP